MEFTPEQATEIINKAVTEFKGAFTPEMTQKMEALKTELLSEIKGAITQEKLDATISALELKMDQFAEKMRPVETKNAMEKLSDEIIEKGVSEIKKGNTNVKFEVKSITSSELVLPNYNTNVDPNAKMAPVRKPTIYKI